MTESRKRARSYVAEFTIPAESFPFGKTLVKMTDVEIEVDQIIPTDESALPFFWVRGCDPEAFMQHAEAEPEVVETKLLEVVEQVALFRAEWRPDSAVIEGIKALDMTIVEAVGTAAHWRFEVRTQDREAFVGFQDIFQEQGIPIELSRLYDLDELIHGQHRTLSSKQRRALLAACQEGYYQKPREVTQENLADRFDISRRALSDRLRRGTRNLISESLLPSGGND